jgi:hypothetical protein
MKIIEKDFNVETGKETIIERDETPAETQARLDKIKEVKALEAEIETKATARAVVLARLGLTEEEAQLIIGGSN